MNEKIVGTLLVVAMCIVCTVPAVVAQETPFVINGYVSSANGYACNNPSVTVTNTDTYESWPAENASASNYYRLVLVNGTDLTAGATLKFEVTSQDGSQSKIVESRITQAEIKEGGRFGYNISLSVPNQQAWYFTTNTASAPINDTLNSGIDSHRIMTKGVEGGADTEMSLPKGKQVWFYADQVADCNVSFPAGTWNVSYWVRTIDDEDSDKLITTRLHGIDSTGAELPGSPYAVEYYNILEAHTVENVTKSLNAAGFTIPEDGRFAIEVLWDSTAQQGLQVYCNPPGKHASQVTSPTSDPGYPIPELPTVLLLGLGLLVFAGYVGLRRRRNV